MFPLTIVVFHHASLIEGDCFPFIGQQMYNALATFVALTYYSHNLVIEMKGCIDSRLFNWPVKDYLLFGTKWLTWASCLLGLVANCWHLLSLLQDLTCWRSLEKMLASFPLSRNGCCRHVLHSRLSAFIRYVSTGPPWSHSDILKSILKMANLFSSLLAQVNCGKYDLKSSDPCNTVIKWHLF